MAKNVVAGDGIFSIGDKSWPKGSVEATFRTKDFVLTSASGKQHTFLFSDIRDSGGSAYANRAAAITGVRAAMTLPEVELVVESGT